MTTLKEHYTQVIEDYIQAYNRFDVAKMVVHFHEDIVFENSANGEVDLRTEGLEDFKNQAEKAKAFFSERKQSIKNWSFKENIVTIEIDYQAVLAIDLPGGAMKGDTLELLGRSEFTFLGSKVILLRDIS